MKLLAGDRTEVREPSTLLGGREVVCTMQGGVVGATVVVPRLVAGSIAGRCGAGAAGAVVGWVVQAAVQVHA